MSRLLLVISDKQLEVLISFWRIAIEVTGRCNSIHHVLKNAVLASVSYTAKLST